LDKLEGAVIVLADEPQDVSAKDHAKSAGIAVKVRRRRVDRALRMAGMAVVCSHRRATAFKMPTRNDVYNGRLCCAAVLRRKKTQLPPEPERN